MRSVTLGLMALTLLPAVPVSADGRICPQPMREVAAQRECVNAILDDAGTPGSEIHEMVSGVERGSEAACRFDSSGAIQLFVPNDPATPITAKLYYVCGAAEAHAGFQLVVTGRVAGSDGGAGVAWERVERSPLD